MMSFLNSLISTAASSVLSNSGDSKMQAIGLVQQLLQQNGGNVGGLLNQLQQGGLGNVVQSWIGNGENASINAEQIQTALGSTLTQAAAAVGLENNQAVNLLVQYLPQIINSLTPNGTAADADGFGIDDIARIAMQQFFK